MSYHVTAQSTSGPRRVAFLAGPFRTHGEALAVEPAARRLARKLDPHAGPWAAYGTAHDRAGHARVGKLNGHLGLVADVDGYVRAA